MNKHSAHPKVDQAVRELQRALGTLPGTTDRPIARRNARARTLAALRKIRGAVDTAYPAIVKRGGYTRLTVQGRLLRLLRAGWVIASDVHTIARYAAAGVPMRAHPGTNNMMLVPRWAWSIGSGETVKLRAAKKSRKLRLAAIVEAGLRTTST